MVPSRPASYWGVVPPGKFNPKAEVTYGEFMATLIKLMAYDKERIREGGGLDFTQATIEKFDTGGDTSEGAKITLEQAKDLCKKTVRWREDMNK